MQRRTILALLVPCALVSAVALADPAPTGADAPPSDGPPPPTPAPAQESPPVPGWDRPSPDEPTPRPAPWTQVPTDVPAPEVRPPAPEMPSPDAPTDAPPTDGPPIEAPSTDAPPTDAPPAEGPADAPGAPILEPPALPEAEENAAFAMYATRPAVAGALYLQGFDVAWEARPHRLRSVIVVADAGAQTVDSAPTGALLARVQGGSWASGARATDSSTVQVAYGGIASPTVQIHRGAVRTNLRGEAPVLGRHDPAHVVVPVEVPIGAGADGRAEDGAAVYLQGLAIETDAAHPDGFTPHVLEVRLGPATVTDGIARFDVTIEVQAAAVPDRDQHLGGYGADVEVGWLLVPAAAARVHRVSASATAAHGIEIEARVQHAEPIPLALGVDLRAGTTEVAAGLSGFRVAVDATGFDAGRYIRSVGVLLDASGVDPWRGRWDGEVEARFNNAGPLTRAEGVTLDADVTVLELVEGERAWSGRWTTELGGEARQFAYPGPERMGRR